MTFADELRGLEWAEGLTDWAGARTLEEVWAECPYAYDMLAYAAYVKCDRKKLVLAACACARMVLPYTEGPHALLAIEAAEAWCRGERAEEEVRLAARAANDALQLAASACTATRAATSAACTVVHPGSAQLAAWAAALTDSQYDRWIKIQTKCADLVREIISVKDLTEPQEEAQ